MRIFRTGRIRSRERVIIVQPNEIFSYELISGLAVRDYKAVVRLQPSGDGHDHPLALDLPGQGARDRLDLPAPAGQVHRPDGQRPGRGGGECVDRRASMRP